MKQMEGEEIISDKSGTEKLKSKIVSIADRREDNT